MPKQQARRDAQRTGRCLRHVDYILAGRGFIHDASSDEDYVDGPLVTEEDIANEDVDVEGLESKAYADTRKVDTLPGGKDTGVAAGDKDGASGEKSVAVGDKDSPSGEKGVAGAIDVVEVEKDVAAGENDDAAGENDTGVAVSEKDDAARGKTVAADTKATTAEPGDNNALADTEYPALQK
ncbi:hypothetical protein PInf_008725 [Phytophthora infestans]|nr:hypothetical protein PInf_008725 [Phytophthora infestans]